MLGLASGRLIQSVSARRCPRASEGARIVYFFARPSTWAPTLELGFSAPSSAMHKQQAAANGGSSARGGHRCARRQRGGRREREAGQRRAEGWVGAAQAAVAQRVGAAAQGLRESVERAADARVPVFQLLTSERFFLRTRNKLLRQ